MYRLEEMDEWSEQRFGIVVFDRLYGVNCCLNWSSCEDGICRMQDVSDASRIDCINSLLV